MRTNRAPSKPVPMRRPKNAIPSTVSSAWWFNLLRFSPHTHSRFDCIPTAHQTLVEHPFEV